MGAMRRRRVRVGLDGTAGFASGLDVEAETATAWSCSSRSRPALDREARGDVGSILGSTVRIGLGLGGDSVSSPGADAWRFGLGLFRRGVGLRSGMSTQEAELFDRQRARKESSSGDDGTAGSAYPSDW